MARVALNLHLPLTDVLLSRGQIWRAEGDLRGEVIQCEQGELWITQQGDLNDYFLNAGERFWVTRPGMVLVEAMRSARFHCSRSTTPLLPETYAHLGYE
jgi:hypothetical protein